MGLVENTQTNKNYQKYSQKPTSAIQFYEEKNSYMEPKDMNLAPQNELSNSLAIASPIRIVWNLQIRSK